MRDDEEEEGESSWFARWEEELPRPEELIPLSQSLITSDVAIAFGILIQNPNLSISVHDLLSPPLDFESPDHCVPVTDDSARTLKRPRLVWTPQLHRRFVDAVAHIGIKKAVPKTIMHLMSVDGLTRENVASHLQKYRLYLKRMQSHGSPSASDADTEQLFAGSSSSRHFLGQGNSGLLMAPPMTHHQQKVVVQRQCYHQKQMNQFRPPVAGGGGYDYGFRTRAQRPPAGLHLLPTVALNSYEDDGGDSKVKGARRILTLFSNCRQD